jgi:integrase
LRAKAASDMATSKQAQALLGHSAASTTDGYIRQRVGQIVQPVTRETK